MIISLSSSNVLYVNEQNNEAYKCVCMIICLRFNAHFNSLLSHISVGPPYQFFWITNQLSRISPKVTNFYSHMISDSAVTLKWPLDEMSEINCHWEMTPRPRIEPIAPMF